MSLLPFIILAKQNEKKSSHNNEKTKEDKSYNEPHVTYKPKYTLEQYIYYLCNSDERVREFFKKLNEASNKIDEIDEKKYLETFVDISNKYFQVEKKIVDKLSDLKKEGLSLTENYRTKGHFYPVETSKGSGFHGLNIGYNECRSFILGFNGIRITEAMLLDHDRNPYEEEYREWKIQNQDILVKEKHLERTIAEKKKKLKFSLLKKKKQKEEIANLEENLVVLKEKIEEGKQKKDKITIFNNLTTSQKIQLLDYFKYIAECEKLGSEIDQIVKAVIAIRYSRDSSNIERDKWNRTFKLFLKSKDFNVKLEMEYVNKLILNALTKEKFSQGDEAYSLNGISNFMADCVDWYISKLSDETKIEEKTSKIK